MIAIHDVLDELMAENQRLMNELLIANQLKRHLIDIHVKYETFISSQDKQHFQQLLTTLPPEFTTTDDTIDKDIKPLVGRDAQRRQLKGRLPKKCVKRKEPIATRREFNGEDINEVIHRLRQKYVNREYGRDSETKRFNCPTNGCIRSYEHVRDVFRHIRSGVHRFRPIDGQSGPDSVECPHWECEGKRFRNKYLLHYHTKCVHKPGKRYLCRFVGCGQTFRTRVEWISHRECHKNEKRFHCPHSGCGYECKDRNRLKVHEECVHLNLRNYRCDECGKE
jgi:hypothetical protein